MKIKIITSGMKELLEKDVNDFLKKGIKVINISYSTDHWYFGYVLQEEYSAMILYED